MRANDLKELFVCGPRTGLTIFTSVLARANDWQNYLAQSAFLLLALGIQAAFLEREVLWRRGRKSGGHGLQANSVT
jgi:hypothetical protein